MLIWMRHIFIAFMIFLPPEGSARIRPGLLNRVKGRHGTPRLNTLALRRVQGKPIARVNKPPEEEGIDGAFESDIRLTAQQLHALNSGRYRKRRKVISGSENLWSNGVIYYDFDPGLSSSLRDGVLAAIKHWEKLTCLRFQKRSSSTESYVVFAPGYGCTSRIGREGGAQETTLHEKCNNLGSIAHELGHVAGFFHEHTRSDRDTFVNILKQNIMDGKEIDFKKRSNAKLVEPYDLGSVMHYGPKWFSKNDGYTVKPIDIDFLGVIGQRDSLSFLDAMTANVVYRCNDHCPNKNQQCANGGYIGPNCKCVCPPGLAGDCNDVIPGTNNCGGVLRGNSGSFKSPNYPGEYGNNLKCYWLITGSPGSSITLQFTDFEIEDDTEGPCAYDHVDIHVYGPDHAGAKFCDRGPSGVISYSDHSLLVSLHSDDQYGFRGFEAKYIIHP